MKSFLPIVCLALILTSAGGSEKKGNLDLKSWDGVYSSPSETGGFSGTVLHLYALDEDTLLYRKVFYTDSSSVVNGWREIDQDILEGRCLVNGDDIYIPEAQGRRKGSEVKLEASIERLTRLLVNGYTVLMRDDALEVFRKKNELYDYGILMRVSTESNILADLKKAKHESIKVLYTDPKKDWKDPFVHGPNKRK
jgi:hypothetical protein